MKVIVIGNSGSGKSTHARTLAKEHGLEHLDLDSIMWEPNQIASAILADDVHLHFLNPGLDVCLRNNAARPWEPEKYETPELQQSMYKTLIDCVKSYYLHSSTVLCSELRAAINVR